MPDVKAKNNCINEPKSKIETKIYVVVSPPVVKGRMLGPTLTRVLITQTKRNLYCRNVCCVSILCESIDELEVQF